MKILARKIVVMSLLAAVAIALSHGTDARQTAKNSSYTESVMSYWTADRVASAVSLDLVIDADGHGLVREPSGALSPYPEQAPVKAIQEVVLAITATATTTTSPATTTTTTPPATTTTTTIVTKDTTKPIVTNMSPATGVTTGTSISFSANATDNVGVKSVVFKLTAPGGKVTSYAASLLNGSLYVKTVINLAAGNWKWQVVATDTAPTPNILTTTWLSFTISTTSTNIPIASASWTTGGDVQRATGRILFEMPTVQNTTTTWSAFVCTGTVVQDTRSDASVIVTAAHCVYDDVDKAFARNVLFIPDQANTTAGAKTDLNCANDPIGCWVPTNGVVDQNWTTRRFPNNVEWDYGYYIVPAAGAHLGAGADVALENAVNELPIPFTNPVLGVRTFAIGYPFAVDPKMMYCADSLASAGNAINWWLPACGLTAGSSGGPWVQPMNLTTGTGPIVSVNSWGYTTKPGMAGPLLDASASCTFGVANSVSVGLVAARGFIAVC